MIDPLTDFAMFFLKNNSGVMPCPFHEGLTFIDGVAGIVLYRQGEFQAQLFICQPNTEIPDHVHPNVDSYEVYVGGEVMFRHGGQTVVPPELASAELNGLSAAYGQHIRVLPDDWHGATIGPKGGAFLSIQHWADVPPTSVERDWRGSTMGPLHAHSIVSGEA